MASMRIVPSLNEVKDGHAGLSWIAETMSFYQLALESCEEALTERVVIAVADGAHGRAYACSPASQAEGNRGILRTLVRVMDYIERTTLANGHTESIKHELCAKMSGHGPSDHTPAPYINHYRQIEKSGPCRNVTDAAMGQFGMNSGGSVSATRTGMDGPDPNREGLIGPRTDRGFPFQPRIVPAGGDLQYTAHCGNGICGHLRAFDSASAFCSLLLLIIFALLPPGITGPFI
jgi:hypothetical protein